MQVTSQWIRNFQSAGNNKCTNAVIMNLPLVKDKDVTNVITLEFAVMALAVCVSTIVAVLAKSNANNFNQ